MANPVFHILSEAFLHGNKNKSNKQYTYIMLHVLKLLFSISRSNRPILNLFTLNPPSVAILLQIIVSKLPTPRILPLALSSMKSIHHQAHRRFVITSVRYQYEIGFRLDELRERACRSTKAL